LRAERKAGALLGEMDRQQQGRPEKRSHDVTILPTLEDIGVTKMQAQRWQLEASEPEEQFEQDVQGIRL